MMSQKKSNIKKCFKNNLTTIKSRLSEIQLKAKKEQNFLLIVFDSVHDPKAHNSAKSAGKYIVYKKGAIGNKFLMSNMYKKKKFFICKNFYDFEEELKLISEKSHLI